MQVVKLHVPARLDYRELATRTVALVCKVAISRGQSGAQREELTNELVSAVGEAFNNVVLHGYRGSLNGDLSIVTEFDAKRIVVELLDNGASFDPAAVAVPDLGGLPESGLGLYIIRSFADEVEYSAGPPNVLRLVKFLPAS
ncbi:MAG: ATP-binding protein [Myxococcota bacterium]